ncbi:MAG: LemA family protein [Acidobacteriaceae bacterium]|nr:LemA family protein [Acidobacteriaceae bacterium]
MALAAKNAPMSSTNKITFYYLGAEEGKSRKGVLASSAVTSVSFGAFIGLLHSSTRTRILERMGNVFMLALLFVVMGVAIYVVLIFNGLISLKNDVTKAWANIDVLLKQRHDELPNLVEVCKGYMNYETETLERVTRARSQYQQAMSVDQKAHADRSTTNALRGLFAVVENYPQLKANENFLKLQNRISELENEIADRREYYNDAVNTFNTRIQQVPDTFVAVLMNLTPRPMFQANDVDRVPVQVSVGASR